MINGKTYYQVLGVLSTAEDLVIRAAYRSLSNKYHPDKCVGDAKYAHDRMIEINLAYETLGDSGKRRQYDEQLKSKNVYDDAADIDRDSSEFEDVYSENIDAWRMAVTFFPYLNTVYERLRKINYSLAYSFKTITLETKQFEDCKQLADRMEREFLSRYFGSNNDVQDLARNLISQNHRDAAKALNKIISVMGNSLTIQQITSSLKNQFPNAFSAKTENSDELPLEELLIRAREGRLSLSEQLRLLLVAGAGNLRLEDHWWHGKVYKFQWVDGSKKQLNGLGALRDFIKIVVFPKFSRMR